MPIQSSAFLPTEPGAYGPVGRSAWLDVDWREHQRTVRVGGRRVNVVELGAGDPPLVFVHGLSGSWRNWLENLPDLARSRRVVAFDLPGFGDSEMPEDPISISGYGQIVEALLDELGLGPVVLVGNSMGGFIGAEVAIRFPARVERLVLVSAAGISVEHERHDRALALLRRSETVLAAWAAYLGARSELLSARPRARRLLMTGVARRADRLPAPLVAEQLRRSGDPGFVAALDALTSYPIRERLGEIGCPTLIVWGENDHLVPVRDADAFEALIDDARKVVWPETGHVPMLERPAAFNALLEAFVEEQPGERVDEPGALEEPGSPLSGA